LGVFLPTVKTLQNSKSPLNLGSGIAEYFKRIKIYGIIFGIL
jgi:hypothetical protein